MKINCILLNPLHKRPNCNIIFYSKYELIIWHWNKKGESYNPKLWHQNLMLHMHWKQRCFVGMSLNYSEVFIVAYRGTSESDIYFFKFAYGNIKQWHKWFSDNCAIDIVAKYVLTLLSLSLAVCVKKVEV